MTQPPGRLRRLGSPRSVALAFVLILHGALAYQLIKAHRASTSEGKSAPAMITPIMVHPGRATRESGAQQGKARDEEVPQWTFAPLYVSPNTSTVKAMPPGNPILIATERPAATVGPRVLRRVLPEFPIESVRTGEEGATLVRLRIDDRGKPSDVQVASSSNSSALDAAAVLAVQQWQFEAARNGARAVASLAVVELRFQLYPITVSLLQPRGAETAPAVRTPEADDTAQAPGGETALRNLISGSGSFLPGKPDEQMEHETRALRAALHSWGPATDVQFLYFVGGRSWKTYALRPEYAGQPGDTNAERVSVRWETYDVQHDHVTTTWRIAVDHSGRIWAVMTGVAPWHDDAAPSP
jgi:TonB family protein